MASAKSAGRLLLFAVDVAQLGCSRRLRLRRALYITLRQPRENRGGLSSKLPPTSEGGRPIDRDARDDATP